MASCNEPNPSITADAMVDTTVDSGAQQDGQPVGDAATTELGAVDAAALDQQTTDLAPGPDGATDVALPDLPLPDLPLPDLMLPDLTPPDMPLPDLLPPDTLSPDLCALPCGGKCCKSKEACVLGACTPVVGPCKSDADCFNDSYCFNGVCIPWGSGPGGKFSGNCVAVVPLGLFAPALQCSWGAPPTGDKFPNHKNVLGTPMVVDFGIKGADPSIVFVSYNGVDGGGEASRCDKGYHGVIRVIRGKDCAQLYSLDSVKVRASSPLAIGDINGDKVADIVAFRCGGGLVAMTYDKSKDLFVQLWVSNPSTTGGTSGLWSGPSIHDLDDDGKPETLMGGYTFDHQGKLVDGALGLMTPSPHPGALAVVADVDGDKKAELVDGNSVQEFDTTAKKWKLQHKSGQTRGLVAVADFGTYGADPKKDNRALLDGVAEVVVVHAGKVRVQTITGRVVFGPVSLPLGGSGGPPTVGDFDNDRRAEVACAGYGSYTVFDPDCKTGALKNNCPSLSTNGILWYQTSQDHSSSSTGSSIYDFDGDGKAEAIYADECFTRVYEGSSGEVLFSQYRTSCTWYENPVVADVDGDGKSELVVPSNTNCNKAADCAKKLPLLPGTSLRMDHLFKGLRCAKTTDCLSSSCDSGFCRCTKDAECGGGSLRCGPPVKGTPGTGNVCRSVHLGALAGVLVYRDVQDRWVYSRPIWNQHTYSVTNVGDDGTIPKTSAWQPNWTNKDLNNYRQNKQGSLNPSGVPDLTSKLNPAITCASGGMTLKTQVCNRGAKAAAAGVSVAFYLGDPKKSGKLGCVAKTKTSLAPGGCELVSCTITPAPTTKVDLYVVPNDDGTSKGSMPECNNKNNWSVIKGAACP